MAYPVPQTDPTSVIGRRVLAALIDIILLFIPFVLLLTSAFEYVEEENLPIADGQEFCDRLMEQDTGSACVDFTDVDGRVYYADDLGGDAWLALWGGSFTLFVLLQAFAGWTPGKLISGIRVVREDGRSPGFVKALLRWLLWLVDGFPYFIPGVVAFILGLTTTGHRRLGDMAAKTFVVRKDAAGSPIVVPGLATGAPTPSAPGWASPTPPPPPVATPPSAPTATEGPQWDPVRGTYIQWDAEQRAWMQWDDGVKTWSRIPGQ